MSPLKKSVRTLRRLGRREIQTTIRRGFPVVVKFYSCPAEPDVGIQYPYVEIDEVLTMKGKSADFLKLTDAELSEIEEKVGEQCSLEADYDDDPRY